MRPDDVYANIAWKKLVDWADRANWDDMDLTDKQKQELEYIADDIIGLNDHFLNGGTAPEGCEEE